MGSLLTAQIDHPVRKATMVPALAPDLRSPAAMGRLTKGPPGHKPPAKDPISIPRNPDSSPTHFATVSWESKVCIIPATIRAKINRGKISMVMAKADFIPVMCCPSPLE
jgi:hypothetical protein